MTTLDEDVIEYPISGPMVEELVKIHSELLLDVPAESHDLVKNRITQAIQKTCFVFEDNWNWQNNCGRMCIGADADEETSEEGWEDIGSRFFNKVNT